MSVDQIKSNLAALSTTEQNEVVAYLFHLRHVADPEYQERVEAGLSDADPARWLTLEQFEHKLNQE